MRKHVLMALWLTLPFGLFTSVHAVHAQSCRLVSLGETQIVQQAGAEVVKAMLNGQPSLVGITLEQPFSLASRHRVIELNLPINRPHFALHGANVDYHMEVATMGELQLGAAHLHGVDAFVEDRDFGSVDILLGSNLLENFLPEFDIGHGMFRLFAKEHCPDQVVYWATDYLKIDFSRPVNPLFVPIKINGQAMTAMLSPGLQHSFITRVQMDDLGVSEQAGGGVMLSTFEFGGVTMRNLLVQNSPPRQGIMFRIGDDILKHLRFIIDFEGKTIYFTVGS